MSDETRCHGCGHAAGLHTMQRGCTAGELYSDRRGRSVAGPCMCWYTAAFAAEPPERRRAPHPQETDNG